MSGVEAISGAMSSASGMSSATFSMPDTISPGLTAIDSNAIGQNPSVGADFVKILDSYRVKADRVDTEVAATRAGNAPGPASQQQMMRQLTDLYSYAVDTQLLVKTAGQVTTSFRQLVTGQ